MRFVWLLILKRDPDGFQPKTKLTRMNKIKIPGVAPTLQLQSLDCAMCNLYEYGRMAVPYNNAEHAHILKWNSKFREIYDSLSSTQLHFVLWATYRMSVRRSYLGSGSNVKSTGFPHESRSNFLKKKKMSISECLCDSNSLIDENNEN